MSRLSRRIFKKIITSCMECPGRGRLLIKTNTEEGKKESWCNEYYKIITHEHLDLSTRMMNFPTFCKLEEER